MIGRGIGRYGSGAADSPRPSLRMASLVALPEVMFLGGAVVHATPTLDLYAYGGEERILSTDFTPGFAGISYGSPTADNSGCNILGSAACSGNVRDTWEITAGFWDKVYQGDFGSLRVGLQYAYIQDDLSPVLGHAAAADPGGLAPNQPGPLQQPASLRVASATIRSIRRRRLRRLSRNTDRERQRRHRKAGFGPLFSFSALSAL